MSSYIDQILASTSAEQIKRERVEAVAEVDALNKRIALLDLMMELHQGTPATYSSKPVPSAVRPQLPEAIKRVMLEEPQRGWTRAELLAALTERHWQPGGQTPGNSLDSTLSRMVKAGRVIRTGNQFRSPLDAQLRASMPGA